MGSVLGFPGVDPSDAAVGARLRRWREQRGMSVDDLARLMDISPEEERRAEAGRAHLDSASIGAATAALRLPLWALVSDTRAY
ncbi:helix-turn-helix domain-containing protein [Brevundimonas sp.]|uniref:helix-turn-helix domain-containing protein n=1 Tax=Brevundimonas sp. TaxID=1871086 RepID=UPI0035AF6842